jgi:hypothetical protein
LCVIGNINTYYDCYNNRDGTYMEYVGLYLQGTPCYSHLDGMTGFILRKNA